VWRPGFSPGWGDRAADDVPPDVVLSWLALRHRGQGVEQLNVRSGDTDVTLAVTVDAPAAGQMLNHDAGRPTAIRGRGRQRPRARGARARGAGLERPADLGEAEHRGRNAAQARRARSAEAGCAHTCRCDRARAWRPDRLVAPRVGQQRPAPPEPLRCPRSTAASSRRGPTKDRPRRRRRAPPKPVRAWYIPIPVPSAGVGSRSATHARATPSVSAVKAP